MSKLRSQRLRRSSLRGQEVVNKKSKARSRNRRDRQQYSDFRKRRSEIRISGDGNQKTEAGNRKIRIRQSEVKFRTQKSKVRNPTSESGCRNYRSGANFYFLCALHRTIERSLGLETQNKFNMGKFLRGAEKCGVFHGWLSKQGVVSLYLIDLLFKYLLLIKL